MVKEIALGFGAAVLVFLIRAGYDVTPIATIAVIAYLGSVLFSMKGLGKKFEVVNNTNPSVSISGITFDDIGGQEVAKRELLEALDFIRNEGAAKHLGIRPLKGILLSGPPGTGKTLLAKAAAGYTDSAFVATSGSEFVEMYAGVGAQRVRQLFKNARTEAERRSKKNAIVFIDEIDVIGGKRGVQRGHLEYDQTLNQLLVMMDGIISDDSIRTLIVAATNRIDLLDSALLRPGRFDRIVKVELPDKEGRLVILKIHTRNKPLDEDVDLDKIARETFGFSGAQLEMLTNEAAILALRENKSVICEHHFRDAIDKVMMGEKLDRRPSEEELRRIAVHEAGHAIISEQVRPGSVSIITVTSRGNALGYMRQVPEDDFYLYTKDYLEGQISVLVAGAVAEGVIFGNRSTGATGDFQEAVKVAKRIVGSGMSDLGIVCNDDLPQSLIHRTVSRIIRKQEDRVYAILNPMKSLLASIVGTLLENEKLGGDELRRRLRHEYTGVETEAGAS